MLRMVVRPHRGQKERASPFFSLRGRSAEGAEGASVEGGLSASFEARLRLTPQDEETRLLNASS